MRTLLTKLIDERLVIFVITVNTLVIFLRAFPSLKELSDGPLFVIDYVCTSYFVLELFIKLRLYGLRAYMSSGWNRFDFSVIVLSLPMLLSPWVDLHDFSVFLVLRITRPLRSFRLLRFVPEGERLWSGIKRGLKATLGVALALLMYNFVLALAACYIFGQSAPEYFADPILSMYSMFKIFTVEGWFDIPDAIAEGSSAGMGAFAKGYFVFAVTTGGLLGLSMANGVFIDEMAMDNNEELEENVRELKQELAELRRENAEALAALKGAVDALGGAASKADDSS